MAPPGLNESKSILKGGVGLSNKNVWPSEAKALCRLPYWPAIDSARYLYSPDNTAIRSLGNLAASSGDRWSRVEITAKYGPI